MGSDGIVHEYRLVSLSGSLARARTTSNVQAEKTLVFFVAWAGTCNFSHTRENRLCFLTTHSCISGKASSASQCASHFLKHAIYLAVGAEQNELRRLPTLNAVWRVRRFATSGQAYKACARFANLQ